MGHPFNSCTSTNIHIIAYSPTFLSFYSFPIKDKLLSPFFFLQNAKVNTKNPSFFIQLLHPSPLTIPPSIFKYCRPRAWFVDFGLDKNLTQIWCKSELWHQVWIFRGMFFSCLFFSSIIFNESLKRQFELKSLFLL